MILSKWCTFFIVIDIMLFEQTVDNKIDLYTETYFFIKFDIQVEIHYK